MSKKYKFENPYHIVLRGLNSKKVEYCVVGVSGINYYASNALHFISTADFDIFIRPAPENVKCALETLQKLDYVLCYKTVENLKIINKISQSLCIKLSQEKKVIVAEGSDKTIVELIQEVSGFTFDKMIVNAVAMEDKDLKIKFLVGRLEDLIQSKQKAGRQKDLLFLKKYKEMI